MRYFIELAYNGTAFYGWQRQPKGDRTVQETLEKAFAVILQQDIELTGCGRTDTGVHAKQYFAHFDLEREIPVFFIDRLNKILPNDIALKKIIVVTPEAHTRFDAFHRSYEYHIEAFKNPFATHLATHFAQLPRLDITKMQEAARLLLDYEEFTPFCKTNSNTKTMRCRLYRSEWVEDTKNQRLVYHISANRFLRGMVRLIVGMCLNVGLGKVTLEEVRHALDTQTLLKGSSSAAPQGLYLTDIRYPYSIE
jgi:tRNA pseudouridine38-40 synthase